MKRPAFVPPLAYKLCANFEWKNRWTFLSETKLLNKILSKNKSPPPSTCYHGKYSFQSFFPYKNYIIRKSVNDENRKSTTRKPKRPSPNESIFISDTAKYRQSTVFQVKKNQNLRIKKWIFLATTSTIFIFLVSIHERKWIFILFTPTNITIRIIFRKSLWKI